MSTQTLTKSSENSAVGIPHSEMTIGWAILKQNPVRKVPKRDVFNAVLTGVAKAFADMNVKSTSQQDRD